MKFTLSTILAFAMWILPTTSLPHSTSPSLQISLHTTNLSLDGTSLNLSKRLGINCRGSGACNGLCGVKLTEIYDKALTLRTLASHLLPLLSEPPC